MIRRKCGRRVHFEEPGFPATIHNYVKAQKLKARFQVRHIRATVDHSQHDYLLNTGPQVLPDNVTLAYVLAKLVEAPLEPRALSIAGRLPCRVLVDRAVGQMRVLVSQLLKVVTIATEPNQTLLVEVELHRVHLSDQHIDSHVPFDPANQQGLTDILLNYALLVVLQFHDIVDQRYSAASRHISRLADPLLVLVSLEGTHKLVVLVGQDVGLRDEVVDFAENGLVFSNQPGERVFHADYRGLGKVNQLLMRQGRVVLSHRWPVNTT